ncbi:hypothetical protein SLA2020_117630 [Shorea laevis]
MMRYGGGPTNAWLEDKRMGQGGGSLVTDESRPSSSSALCAGLCAASIFGAFLSLCSSVSEIPMEPPFSTRFTIFLCILQYNGYAYFLRT